MPGSLDLSCGESMMSQFCRWPTERFEDRECMAVEEAALGLAHLGIDHLAHLVMTKEIASHRGGCPPADFFAHFPQQSVSQDLVERYQGRLFFQIGDAAEQLKGGSLSKDGTGTSQGTSLRLKLLQLRQDEPSHARGKHALVLCRIKRCHVELQLLST